MPSISQVSELTARIDGLLTQLGGQGSNLREKAASLSGRLSGQTITDIQQLDYLRENALQGGAGLSDIEMDRFNRLSQNVTGDLQAAVQVPQTSYATPQPQANVPTSASSAWGDAPTPHAPMSMGGIPQRLSWVTTPLLILLIMQVLGLLMLPFIGPMLNAIFSSMASDPSSGVTTADLGMMRMFTGGMLWVSFLIGALWAAFIYFAWRAAQQGKSWARIAAIVMGVLNLLNFPIGTILGVFLLIGAFDQDVQRYFNRGL